ncbi:hypothetical protein [Cetobacterium sp. SF1]|uniref:hypothetical protein n=1 Tax=Cetobacterium sp. SF1 TaxID=3417654 RepID=UPI003CF2DD0E
MNNIREILDTSFICKNTNCKSLEEFLEFLELQEEDIHKLSNHQDERLNKKIGKMTPYENTLEFLKAAKIAYVEKTILNGLDK